MNTTITVRTDEKLREELENRAAALGKSLSELVRDILSEAVSGAGMVRLKGALTLPRHTTEPWRRQLRRRNWRS